MVEQQPRHLQQERPAAAVAADIAAADGHHLGKGLFREVLRELAVDPADLLAPELRLIADELVERHAEKRRQLRQHRRVRQALPALPLRDGRLRHADVVGEHLLCEPLRLPQTGDIFRKVQKFHRVFPHFCSHYTRPRRPAQATRATLGEKKSTAAIHRARKEGGSLRSAPRLA